MRCPNCGCEMQKGNIFSGRRDMGVCWYPDGVEPSRFYMTEKGVRRKGGVCLSSPSYQINGSFLEAYLCLSCHYGVFIAEDA